MKRRDFIATTATGLGAAAAVPAFAALSGDKAATAGTLFEYVICAELFWPNEPFLNRLAKVAESGFRRFEFWRFRDKDIDAIAKMCRQHGLTPQQFVASFSMNSTERRAQFIQDLKDAVIVADKLGVSMMTVIPGAEIEGMSRDQQTQEVIKSLRKAEVIARKADMTLMIEPVNVLVDHPGQLIVTSQQAAEIVQAVGSPHVRMLFDVYHQQISEGNLSGNIDKFKDDIAYYQIADHPGRHEPGTGEVNFVHVLQTIKQNGYAGPIGLECKPKGTAEEALQAVLQIDALAAASGAVDSRTINLTGSNSV